MLTALFVVGMGAAKSQRMLRKEAMKDQTRDRLRSQRLRSCIGILIDQIELGPEGQGEA